MLGFDTCPAETCTDRATKALLSRAFSLALASWLASCAGTPPRKPSNSDAPPASNPALANALDSSVAEEASLDMAAYIFGEVDVGKSKQRLRAMLGACDDSGCPIEVQLLENGALLDSRVLPWRAAWAMPSRAPLDVSGEVGDPMQPDLTSQATTVGDENAAVTVYVEPFRLGGAGEAMLIHLIAGFEHIKRSRELVMASGTKLVSTWRREESQGPERSVVEVIDLDDDGDDELRNWTFKGPDWLRVDSVRFETLAWDADQRIMRPLPAAPMLSAVVLRDFATEKAARAGQSKVGTTCPDWTLFAPGAVGGAPAKYWLGAVTAHPEIEKQALAHAKRCAPYWNPQLKALAAATVASGQDYAPTRDMRVRAATPLR